MNSFRGKVIAIGNEVDRLDVNDVILFGQYSGTEFELNKGASKKDGNDYLIMNQEDVLCTINKGSVK